MNSLEQSIEEFTLQLKSYKTQKASNFEKALIHALQRELQETIIKLLEGNPSKM